MTPELADSLKNIVLLPIHLFKGMISGDFSSAGRDFIGLSPAINSVNDHTGFSIKKHAFNRYGFWGYFPGNALGTNFGAMYAFLPNFFMWRAGVCGYVLFSLIVYLAAIIAIGTTDGAVTPVFCIMAPVSLLSPYLKNSLFIAGRYDFPGWPLLAGGLWFLVTGSLILAFVFLTLAFMTHPSVALVGSVYLAGILVINGLQWPVLFLLISAHVLNLFWYIPFYNTVIRRPLPAEKQDIPEQDKSPLWQWALSSSDTTRTFKIHLQKAIGMLCFIVPFIIIVENPMALWMALLPFVIFLISTGKESFINRFSIEILWISVLPMAVVLGTPGAIYAQTFLCFCYLLSIFFYASPAPRFGFPFRPLTIDPSVMERTFGPLQRQLVDGTRICFLHLAGDADQWRLNTKYSCLISKWLFRQNRRLEKMSVGLQPFGGEAVIREMATLEQDLEQAADRFGISHFLVPEAFREKIDPLRFVSVAAETSLPEVGSVPGTRFILYRVNHPVARIAPEGEINESENGDLLVKCNSGRHEIKYRYLPGVRAFQGDREIAVEIGCGPIFFISPPEDKNVTIHYDYTCLWSPIINLVGKRTTKEGGIG